ncbi:hypothetical protein [Nonomuraea wenchangensis]|uniref:hypothetical protein n=1 Tax=Nonomuraea wenchangensis TaxID=568860 RepID=UPI003328326E
MATLTIRDPYGNTFEVDATARPYWEHREGHTILDTPEPESAPEMAQEPKPAEAAQSRANSPKPSSKPDRINVNDK